MAKIYTGDEVTVDNGNNFTITPDTTTLQLYPTDTYSYYSGGNDKMNIYKKLNDAMQEIGWVGKNGSVDMGKSSYDYATESDFIAEVRPVFARLGLVIYPTDVSNLHVERIEKEGKYGATVTLITTAVLTYIIGDTDSGQNIEVAVIAQGMDQGDKGSYKLMTGAYKYALRQALMIGTGDDPEATDDEGQSTSGGTTRAKKSGGSDHYKTRVKEALDGVDLTDAEKVLKKNKINVNRLPNDQAVLRALFDFGREVKGGSTVADAAANLDSTLGSLE